MLGDLDVSSQKISYTYTPSKEVSSAGLDNCISAAVLEALAANGGGDVLVETQTAVVERGFFNKIKSVTVSGYPARYKNFRPADAKALNAAVEKSDFTVQTKNRGNGGGFLKLLGL